MTNTDIYAPEGLLETSLAWQEVIDSIDAPEDKDAMGVEACAALNRMDGFYGVRKIVVKSSLAVIMADPSPENQVPTGVKYRDISAKGWLGKVAYMGLRGYDTLAWPLRSATILNEPESDVPEEMQPIADLYPQTDGTLRPVYLPVGFIDVVICAA
jgi:hypothetical protein